MPLPLVAVLAAPLLLAPAPPPTHAEPVVETVHGTRIVDEYRWLEALEADSPTVQEWTTRQNDYTRSILDGLPGRDALEARLTELMTVGFVGVPTMRDRLYFYTERRGEQSQPVLYVREGHDGPPRVLLDPNTLDDEGLYSLDWFEPDPRGERLAFGLSYAGDEMTVLHLLDVASGMWLADELRGKVYHAGWSPDGTGFLYGRLDDPKDAYSRSIRYHVVGHHDSQDPVLALRQDTPSRVPFGSLSRNGRWILIGSSEGWSRNDLLVADVDRWRREGTFDLVEIAVDRPARFDAQFVHGDTLYMMTTLDAPQGRLVAVDLNHPGSPWHDVVPERPGAVLQSAALARGLFVVTWEQDATTRFERFRLDGTSIGPLNLPGLGTASIAPEPDRTEAFVSYMSYNEPRSIYRVDLASDERALWARPDVPVDPGLVVVKQEWCTSRDGTRVPMFIVHRRGIALDGTNPCLLYAYGGFNVSLTPWFSATLFPWFEAGGVYAVANLRGGGEYGESWHRAGMLEQKQNVFDDFYAAAEHLIERGYTNPDRLAIQGGSNGGLLTGVAITQRPDLFKAAISAVPLLDMARYDQFLMARFWVPEYGSPEDPEQLRWLLEYSPYHNVVEGRRYPAVLFTAGENDSRVHPMHARKMVALMQAESGNDPERSPILLWVDRAAGHGSGKPLKARIRDRTDSLAFVMWQTGLLSRPE